jgi:hypothetical protein
MDYLTFIILFGYLILGFFVVFKNSPLLSSLGMYYLGNKTELNNNNYDKILGNLISSLSDNLNIETTTITTSYDENKKIRKPIVSEEEKEEIHRLKNLLDD